MPTIDPVFIHWWVDSWEFIERLRIGVEQIDRGEVVPFAEVLEKCRKAYLSVEGAPTTSDRK